jgi:hypothetical protein
MKLKCWPQRGNAVTVDITAKDAKFVEVIAERALQALNQSAAMVMVLYDSGAVKHILVRKKNHLSLVPLGQQTP